MPDTTSNNRPTIAILGGTGKLGPGLALRWARAGLEVVLGSRDAARATAAVTALGREFGGDRLRGASNAEAAAACDVAVVTVPFEGLDSMAELAQHLLGKTVISTVVPMTFSDRRAQPLTVAEGSAAERLAALLPDSHITAALHTVSAHELSDPTNSLAADCLVAGDSAPALAVTVELIDDLNGLRPLVVGDLAQAHLIEQITPLLIGINRRYKVTAGIRITGISAPR